MASTDKILLNYLVFDDENEEKVQCIANVNVPGFECNLIFLNPVDFWDGQTDEFRLKEFENRIAELVKGRQINLIASDWNMVPKTKNHDEINALEIIKILANQNPKFRRIQYLVYSGKPSEVSEVLISEIKKELNSSSEPIYSKELLSMLLELKIKFCSRGERFNEIKTLIVNSKTISLIFLNSIAKFDANLVHNTGNGDFDGKQIGYLLDLISQNNDLGLKFIREIIEMSISYYSRLNE